jgi:Zn-dependent protease with chaperone function
MLGSLPRWSLLFMERSHYANWDTKTALIYYLIPFFLWSLATFLNQNIVLSQIISMGIIISGLLIIAKLVPYSLFKHKKVQ